MASLSLSSQDIAGNGIDLGALVATGNTSNNGAIVPVGWFFENSGFDAATLMSEAP